MTRLPYSQDDIEQMAKELLRMEPDPIPRFILLKEFMHLKPTEAAYKRAYEKVLAHPFVVKLEKEQTSHGYWGHFHVDTEAMIQRCLSIGLAPEHPCLSSAVAFIEKVLKGEDIWHQRCEKQDNPRWWLEMFMPLVSAASLSLIHPNHPLLDKHIEVWERFAQAAWATGEYRLEQEKQRQIDYFKINTKRIIPFYNYYAVLFLTSRKEILEASLDKKILSYCLQKKDGMYYIYDNQASVPVPINDTKCFYHWLRLLTILSRFQSWEGSSHSYCRWIWKQRNETGFWDLGKKPRGWYFPLSDSWRIEKNRIIDSSIFVLRLLKQDAAAR
ncbi:hypothetical protein SAMN05421736_101770 [Evansella caseinilytica]|uniref:Uncharacterized protein n=1 Tax=Evansella caseinilytica TaxID=1503961 RepID=A0A1H3IB22_9BACI|nr:hypothetical protein [Evansella caseinilytica]SDY24847.1 hypothetical protein SAMN05421736_101770 [Evansella caseinilytica]